MDKIPPINPNANNFGNFDGRNNKNNQNNKNSKDSSKDSKQKQSFSATMQELFKEIQREEQNNDNTNAKSNNNTTTQIRTPTNPYGIGNGGNNRFDSGKQEQSANIEKDGRGNSTTHNGGFTQILSEKDERSEDLEAGSGAESRESGAMGEGSENITRLRNAEAYTTTAERSRIYRLAKKGQEEHSILKYLLNRQKLEATIKDSLKGIENANNTIQLINHIKTLDKTLTTLKKISPNNFNNELIKTAEEKLTPLKEKYLSKNNKENTNKNKSKSNDNDLGMGM